MNKVKVSSTIPSITTYQASYELKFPWIAPDPKYNTHAICTWCKTTINISSMGQSALSSHVRSKKHQEIERNRRTCLSLEAFTKKTPELSSQDQIRIQIEDTAPLPIAETKAAQFPPGQQKKSSTLEIFMQGEQVTRSEVIWCLRTVMSHIPIRSSADCVSTFPIMFEDSPIAGKMQLQRTKLAYSIVYGIAPYFLSSLQTVLKSCDKIVVGYDESMNSVVHKAQMDVHVRYWDPENSQVSVRYFDSVFLQRARAADLCDALKSSLGSENMKKTLQVYMDGPNVNLKVFKELNSELKESFEGTGLLDIGSCGLHVVHGAFKTGILETNWDIIKFFRAIFYLFKDSPTRRALYTEYSGSSRFPKSFCGIRWVENVSVASTALEILPHLKTYVRESVKEGSAPTSQSFKTVSECVNDNMLGPKIAFFSATASVFEPFLREFQNDDPMAPFLYSELRSLEYSLMKRVVTSDALNSTSAFWKIDLSDKRNLLSAKKFETDFTTKEAIRNTKNIVDLDILKLRNDMLKCIVAILKKLRERSPLKFKLTEGISCLDPAVATKQVVAEKRLTTCLEILVSTNRLSGVKADRVKREYVDLCSQSNVQEELKKFQRHKCRLDKFWMNVIDLSSKPCDSLRDFVQMILLLSHGSAGIERGFSINAECLVENQHEHSLIAQRRIYDAVLTAGGLSCVKIEKSLLQSMRCAHSRYKEHLSKQRAEDSKRSQEETLKKRKLKEIQELEAKKAKCLADAAKEASEIDSTITELMKM